MYKTLLRTLSALSIVTITASAGFAQDEPPAVGSPEFCALLWNEDNAACQVTTEIWLESLGEQTSIKDAAATEGADNQFVRFGPNGFNNAEGNLIFTGNPKRGELNLEVDVVNDDDTMAKKTIGGVLFYRDLHHDLQMDSRSYHYYAGIKSDTDLGRPLSESIVEAGWTQKWKGKITTVWNTSPNYHLDNKDFTLKITFNGGTGKVGTISARVNQQGAAHYNIVGEFDRKGVITGNVTYGFFNSSESLNPYTDIGRIDGKLSGLIGDKGAVGVFVSDTTTNRLKGFTGGFVVNGFTVADAALLRRCVFDPFDNLCSDEKFANRKIARIEHCVTDDNLVVSDKNCDGAIGATISGISCILNPFQTVCTEEDADYASQYVAARADRATFCGKSENSSNEVCKDITLVDFCRVNPLDDVCESDYAVQTCLTTRDCTDAVLKRPNAVTWENSYDALGNPPSGYRFLRATADEIHRRFRATLRANGEPRSGDLNLNTATFDGEALGGDVADGVVYLYGADGTNYAAIFPGTDLGAPVTQKSGVATWYGQFRVSGRFKRDFTLEINFGAGSTDGSVEAFVPGGGADNYGNLRYYLLKGNFDSNGVISGTVDRGNFGSYSRIAGAIRDTYRLTGLIGTEGAVGVFASPYIFGSAGGFVAVPEDIAPFGRNVKFSNWVRIFDEDPYSAVPQDETQQTRFLQGRGTRLSTDYLRDIVRPVSPLSLADINADGEVADGVDYMSGNHTKNYNPYTGVYSGAITTHHVVGILSGTNLGAILPTVPAGADDNPIIATWKGRLGLVANGSEGVPRDIDLTVDFTNSKLKIADFNINNTHFVSFVNGAGAGDGIKWDEHGVLDGKINYRAASDGEDSKGIVRGLIGKDGAVGAFRSIHVDNPTATHTSYAGGFVAAPPAITYLNWLNGRSGIEPAAVPNTSPRKNQFLHGGESSLSSVGFDAPLPGSLTLADATFGSGGDVADGVAFFRGTHGGTKYYYAGVLSGTNLGSPLIERVTNATWDGRFQFVNGSGLQNAVDFDLKVTFHGSGLHGRVGSIKAFISDAPVNPFYIDGFFDANGFITGYVAHSATLGSIESPNIAGSSIATLRGIIGQQGAVGAFTTIQREGADAITVPYSGGFVARP